MNSFELLIIEPDVSRQGVLKSYLEDLGIFKIEILTHSDDLAKLLEKFTPDLLLANYRANVDTTIKDLILQHSKLKNLPCIVYTLEFQKSVLNDIIDLVLVDFLPFPMKKIELEKALLLGKKQCEVNRDSSIKFNDYIFVRMGKDIKKLKISDILYVVVDGKYIELHTSERRFFVRSTLTALLERLPSSFIKTHKAYAVNLEYLDTINMEDSTVKIGNETLPLSRSLKKEILDLFYVA